MAENLVELLEQAQSSAEEAGHTIDTIAFVVEAAGEYCGDVTAMDHWLLVIDALANKAGRVLAGEPGNYRKSKGLITRLHQLHRDGVLMISPDVSDLDEAEALSLFDDARTVACGGAQ